MNGMCASLIFFSFYGFSQLLHIGVYCFLSMFTHTHTLFVFASNGVPNLDAKKKDSWLQGIQIQSQMRICSLLIFILQTTK